MFISFCLLLDSEWLNPPVKSDSYKEWRES